MHAPTKPRNLLIAAATLALTVTLSACGGGSTRTSSGDTSTSSGGTSSTTGGAPSGTGPSGGGGFPGVSGSVAAISGSSMEVQNQQTGQLRVSWISSTAFTKTATVSSASIIAGDCVTVIGSKSSGSLVAATVMISQPDSSGNCTSDPFGQGGSGSGTGGGFPGGAPPNGGSSPNGGSLPNRPSGSLPNGGAGFAFAFGKVTSISPTSLVLYGTSSSDVAGAPGQSSTPPTSVTSTTVHLTISSSTRYSETQSTSAKSLAVGDCVTANGSTASTGAVTARTIRITSTGGQSCSSGFGSAGVGNNG